MGGMLEAMHQHVSFAAQHFALSLLTAGGRGLPIGGATEVRSPEADINATAQKGRSA